MAKVKASRTVSASDSTTDEANTNSIDSVRNEIDSIDQELVRLMNARANLALEIGKLKHASGTVVYDPAREEEVFRKVTSFSNGPLPELCLRAIFRELISGSRSLEKEMRVAFLGPEYSYSHLAAIQRFGRSVQLVPVASIAAVFEEVHRGHVDFGLVPIQNSTDGRVTDTFEMFTRLPLRICGEMPMRIHHCLLAKCPRSEIKEVYSKPQALSQCRNWLAKHLPEARLLEVTSTSHAAKLALDTPGVAAIASREAGEHYGLDTIVENIEDNVGNQTRFAVIGTHNNNRRTGSDKTTLMFEVEHRAGALADAMAIFKRQRVNLTWIESFPISRPEGGYLFFVELEGHEQEIRIKRAIGQLSKKTIRLVVLGSYGQTPVIE